MLGTLGQLLLLVAFLSSALSGMAYFVASRDEPGSLHTHYLPKDRNETVPVSSFPMRPPDEGERITPDGDIVSKE